MKLKVVIPQKSEYMRKALKYLTNTNLAVKLLSIPLCQKFTNIFYS